jgi:signal peptidase I
MASDADLTKRPRWWIAALLNLVSWVGVGYLYVRRPGRALVVAILQLALLIAAWHGLGGWLARPWVIFAAVAAVVLLLVVPAIDAARLAKQTTSDPRWYNRWWIYLAAVVASTAAAYPFDYNMSVRSFYTPASSMEPTLRIGDRFLVDLRAFERGAPERGDVVIFRLPRDPSILYMKRIIGLPGDEVQVKGGVVHLNGQTLPTEIAGEYTVTAYAGQGGGRTGKLKRETLGQGRSAIVLDIQDNAAFDNTPSFKVPADHYFMLGDNRDNSTDSRDQSPRFGVGYVPRARLVGKITWIYWSSDWSRIGKQVE